jgi:Zn-dependent protease
MDSSFLTSLPIWIAAFVLASTIHEFSHGWMAYKLGDNTALYAGRLTLNPIAHIDPAGIIVLIVLLVSSGGRFGFGWAKPVPYNPMNLRNPKMASGLIALAGPVSNLILVVIFALLAKAFESSIVSNIGVARFFGIFILFNIILAGFNMIPIPPLDGSKVLFSLLPGKLAWGFLAFEKYGFLFLVILMVTPLGDYVIPMFIDPIFKAVFLIFNLPPQILTSL